MGGSAHISTDIVERKRAMRAEALAARAAINMPSVEAALVASIARVVDIPPSAVVACVWPLPGEPDLRPLLTIFHEQSCVVCLPETPPRGQALNFRRWMPGCTMLPGRFGTHHPDGGLEVPRIMLVPLLAFDAAGYRLGYGGGYYDRTLAALPGCLSVGFGLAAQQVANIPREPHDLALDMIVTERGSHMGKPGRRPDISTAARDGPRRPPS